MPSMVKFGGMDGILGQSEGLIVQIPLHAEPISPVEQAARVPPLGMCIRKLILGGKFPRTDGECPS